MPITFTADKKAKTLHSTASGVVSFDDLSNHIRAKGDLEVLHYAELFDARGVNLDLSLADLHTISEKVQHAMGTMKPGRVAVVTDSGFIAGLARAYQAITKEHNPHFEVFQDFEEAREWLTTKGSRKN